MSDETAPCGCVINHKKKTVMPCKEHVLDFLAVLAQDNDGKIRFVKK